jgi:hypothetical protein
MEIVGVIASISGILTLATSIGQHSNSVLDSVRRFRTELQLFTDEVASVSRWLDGFQKTTEKLEEPGAQSLDNQLTVLPYPRSRSPKVSSSYHDSFDAFGL